MDARRKALTIPRRAAERRRSYRKHMLDAFLRLLDGFGEKQKSAGGAQRYPHFGLTPRIDLQ
jgi:hypothetical protein